MFSIICVVSYWLCKDYFYLDDDYLLYELIIPKIQFKMNLYDLNSDLNNIDGNIEILDDSNIENNLFFIAGHSGNGDKCFFNRIRELVIGDYVYIVNDNVVLIYKVVNSYFIVKDGYMESNGYSRNFLYLVTCDIYNNNRQLIVEGILVN